MTNTGDTPSVRNGASATTTVNSTVTLTVEVLNQAGSPIQNAQTAIYATETVGAVSKGDELLSGSGGLDTNASGIAQNTGFDFPGEIDIEVRVRKSSPGDTRYKPLSAVGTITANGFSTTVTLILETNV